MQKPAVVVGIGINIQHDEATVPEDLKEKMTWLRRDADTKFSTNNLAVEILLQLENYYQLLLDGRKSDILNDWRKLSVNIGKEVSCQSGNQTIVGEVIDINEQGALLLRTKDGVQTIYAGEVSIRNLDGSYT
jgi:BirA family biotin operon repressor/biotin-[acetyl-CoA-carboxylase] ligase